MQTRKLFYLKNNIKTSRYPKIISICIASYVLKKTLKTKKHVINAENSYHSTYNNPINLCRKIMSLCSVFFLDVEQHFKKYINYSKKGSYKIFRFLICIESFAKGMSYPKAILDFYIFSN